MKKCVLVSACLLGVPCRYDGASKPDDRVAELKENYELIPFAGTDNHKAGDMEQFGGIATEEPIADVRHFIDLVLARAAKPFVRDENGIRLLAE